MCGRPSLALTPGVITHNTQKCTEVCVRAHAQAHTYAHPAYVFDKNVGNKPSIPSSWLLIPAGREQYSEMKYGQEF